MQLLYKMLHRIHFFVLSSAYLSSIHAEQLVESQLLQFAIPLQGSHVFKEFSINPYWHNIHPVASQLLHLLLQGRQFNVVKS
jgi:hypothetical protein